MIVGQDLSSWSVTKFPVLHVIEGLEGIDAVGFGDMRGAPVFWLIVRVVRLGKFLWISPFPLSNKFPSVMNTLDDRTMKKM